MFAVNLDFQTTIHRKSLHFNLNINAIDLQETREGDNYSLYKQSLVNQPLQLILLSRVVFQATLFKYTPLDA